MRWQLSTHEETDPERGGDLLTDTQLISDRTRSRLVINSYPCCLSKLRTNETSCMIGELLEWKSLDLLLVHPFPRTIQ